VPGLSLSERMTIVVFFYLSGYKGYILGHFKEFFPQAVIADRFISLMPHTFVSLVVLTQALRGKETGKYFVDSAKSQVCHNLRIPHHKNFKDLAKRGKTSTGWFFGFNLHLIINERQYP